MLLSAVRCLLCYATSQPTLHSGFKRLKPATKSVHSSWYFTNFLANRFLQFLKFPFPVLLFTSIFKLLSNCCRHKYDQLISRTFSVWFLVSFSHLAQPCIAAAAPALPWPCSLCCCLFQWLATTAQPSDCLLPEFRLPGSAPPHSAAAAAVVPLSAAARRRAPHGTLAPAAALLASSAKLRFDERRCSMIRWFLAGPFRIVWHRMWI